MLVDDLSHIFKPTTIHTTFHPVCALCNSFQNQYDAILHAVHTKTTNFDHNNLHWQNNKHKTDSYIYFNQNITDTWASKCCTNTQLFMWGHFFLWVKDYHANCYILQWCKWSVYCSGIWCQSLGDYSWCFQTTQWSHLEGFKCLRILGTNYPVMMHHIPKEETPLRLLSLKFWIHCHTRGQTRTFQDTYYHASMVWHINELQPVCVSSCYNHYRLVKREF